MSNIPRFNRTSDLDFINELKTNVNEYFKTQNLSKYGNTSMFIKSVVLTLAYFIPYILIITGTLSSLYFIMLAYAIMGVAMAGIGFSIMHDANHGAYSKKKIVNTILGNFIYFIGASSITWKIQHNVLHHTFTNVESHDEDIDPGIFMRLSPHAKRYKLHYFQHIYGWAIYGLMTFLWLTTKDFNQLARYRKQGLLKGTKADFIYMVLQVAFAKILYYAFFFVLPIFTLPIVWWQTVLCFILMHFIAGFILGVVFQPAHVMPAVEFPLPDEKSNEFENAWAVHQLHTTTNFAKKNKVLSWFVGGLNFQIEHHLFPNICHVHYPKISDIVKKTAEKYGHPYHYAATYRKALYNHGVMLKKLGKGLV